MKKTINQTDLVKITFGMLILKETNSKRVSSKQNGIQLRNTYIKILIDSCASGLIIYESYVRKISFITGKISAFQWSKVARSFSMSCKAKITLKMPVLNVSAHIFVSFHVTTKKVIMM